MNKSENISLIALLGYLFGLVLKKCKFYALLAILVCGAVGCATAANTLLKQWFFEAVTAAVGGAPVGTAVWWGVVLGIFLAITLALHGVSDVLMDNLGIRISGFFGWIINEKAGKIDPVCFENTEMLNDINKAYQGVTNAGEVMKIAITNIAFYTPYFVFFSIYLFKIHPVICFGVLLVFVPTVLGRFIHTRLFLTLEDTVAPVRRRMMYYESCIVDRGYAKETRLLGAVWFFRKLYEINLLLFQKEQWKTQRKSVLIWLGIQMISLIIYVIILILLLHYLHVGVINTSIFAAVFTSVDQMFYYMDHVGSGLNFISSNLPAVHNSMRFLNLPERQGSTINIDNYSIQYKNVSFSYPNANRCAIANVNITIEKGQTVAIVGGNGAGKSTLIKLMIGLYLPTEGDILVGGHNTRDIAPLSLNCATSAVFQKHQQYKMTLSDNIGISQTKLLVNPVQIEESLKKADFPVNHRSLSNGLDTMLSREFEGTDLSGGQWQRVAIGRGFYRNHEMIILDEPTAAIDPIEETRVYKQFAELSKGKTAVIVTHRLGSAKIADKIIVLDDGRIDDYGTHDELMTHDGVYYHMYTSQAKWYT